MPDKIVKYAHVAEIIDRIAIEILKVHEFIYQSYTAADEDAAKACMEKAGAAGQTADFQEGVLRERLRLEHEQGDDLADVLIGAIHISVGAGIVSQYENLKRKEHKGVAQGAEPRVGLIAAWDGVSRDACELRGNGKSALNMALKKFLPKYEYPVEGRTF